MHSFADISVAGIVSGNYVSQLICLRILLRELIIIKT